MTSCSITGGLLLRVAPAALFPFHGIAQPSGGVGFVTTVLAKAGLPAGFGYLVYIG